MQLQGSGRQSRRARHHDTSRLPFKLYRQNPSSSRHCSKNQTLLKIRTVTSGFLFLKCNFFFFVKSCQYFCEVFELAGVGLMCASERCDMESPGEDTGRVAPPAPHTPAGPQPNGSNKIIGRNVNGTSKSRSAINLLMFYIFFSQY